MPQHDKELLGLLYIFQAFNTLAHPIKQAKAAGYVLASRVLDISHVDVSISQVSLNMYACIYV